MSRLNGKVVLITRRSSGIGVATAHRFVDEGEYGVYQVPSAVSAVININLGVVGIRFIRALLLAATICATTVLTVSVGLCCRSRC